MPEYECIINTFSVLLIVLSPQGYSPEQLLPEFGEKHSDKGKGMTLGYMLPSYFT